MNLYFIIIVIIYQSSSNWICWHLNHTICRPWGHQQCVLCKMCRSMVFFSMAEGNGESRLWEHLPQPPLPDCLCTCLGCTADEEKAGLRASILPRHLIKSRPYGWSEVLSYKAYRWSGMIMAHSFSSSSGSWTESMGKNWCQGFY